MATNAASPGYYTDEQIAEKRIHAARATSIESIRNSAIEKGLEFNIPWQGYRPPNMFADSTPYGTSYVHPTRGTLILAGFNLLGMAEKYHIGGDRGGTTAGDSKGTGDADQYQPLPFGPEAFDRLDKESMIARDSLSPGHIQMLQKGLDAITRQKGYEAAKREQERLMRMYGIYLPLVSYPTPQTGADDGTEFSFLPFGGDDKNKPIDPTKKQKIGTTKNIINFVIYFFRFLNF